jgi:hypothetical protein
MICQNCLPQYEFKWKELGLSTWVMEHILPAWLWLHESETFMWSWQSLSWSTHYLHGSLRLIPRSQNEKMSSCPTPIHFNIIIAFTHILPNDLFISDPPTISNEILTSHECNMPQSSYSPPWFDHGNNDPIKFFIYLRAYSTAHRPMNIANRARWIQSIPPNLIFLRSILILSSHLRLCLPGGLFPSGKFEPTNITK